MNAARSLPVRLLVLGTGRMAANHVEHFRAIDGVGSLPAQSTVTASGSPLSV
ncbi:MAG: hypothetical protein R3C97_13560 [Geminicoccaceae bacterium]